MGVCKFLPDGKPGLMEWTTYIGIGGSSLIPGRPDDRFGIAYFRSSVSNALKDALGPLVKLNDESGVKGFYNIAVIRWLRIIGNLQFINRRVREIFPRSTYAGLGTYIRLYKKVVPSASHVRAGGELIVTNARR